ncbi:1260_t:CDS:2, partial [Dentiscutata erythropus]
STPVMTESTTHEYFDRKSSEWNITGFLEECEVESLELKIDCYLKSLEYIAKYEQGNRSQRAQTLLDKYRELQENGKMDANQIERLVDPQFTFTTQQLINNSGTINDNKSSEKNFCPLKSLLEDFEKLETTDAEDVSTEVPIKIWG